MNWFTIKEPKCFFRWPLSVFIQVIKETGRLSIPSASPPQERTWLLFEPMMH